LPPELFNQDSSLVRVNVLVIERSFNQSDYGRKTGETLHILVEALVMEL